MRKDQTLSKDEAKRKFPTYKTRELKGHSKKVHDVAWNINGKLASGSVDQTINIWDIERSNKPTLTLKGHKQSVDQISFDPVQPDIIASCSTDKTVRFWDIRIGKEIGIVPTKGENINLAYRPDGQFVVVSNKQDTVSFIDVPKRTIVKNIGYKHEVNEVRWDNTGTYLMMTTGFGTIEVYNFDGTNLTRLRSIPAHASNIYCIEFDPLGNYFAVGSADSLVTIWSLPEMINTGSLAKMEYPVRALSFSFDGQYIAHAAEDTKVNISHLETTESIFDIKTNGPTNTLSWHPNQYILAYSGESNDKYNDESGIISLFISS